MKNKKGEITTQQIVLLVVLIASFAVILFFLLRLNLSEESQKELCRNSVILKGNDVTRGSTQLNCYRSYECVTADGSCEGLNDPIKHNANSKEEVYETLANNMAECWWMFGEGKVNYVGGEFVKNNYCGICSQVLLDDSLKTIGNDEGNTVFENGEINEDDFYNYLTLTQRSGDETYAEYIFGTNDIERVKQISIEQEGVGTFGTLDIGKQFFVVTGITSETEGLHWFLAGAAGVVTGAIVASNPIGWVTGGIAIATVSAGGAVAGEAVTEGNNPEIGAIVVQGKGVENSFMAPTIVEADSDKFKALSCEEILTFS